MNVRSFTYQGFESGSHDVAANTQKLELKPIVQEQEVIAPRPMFTTEDMELAKTLAREEGIREGAEAAKKQFEQEKLTADAQSKAAAEQAITGINLQLQALLAESQANKQKFSDRMGQLALSIAQKVCGDVSAKIVEEQIANIIKESLEKIDSKDEVKIFVNNENVQHLNDKFTGAAVNGDQKMQAGDFRIEWKNGFAERDIKKLWKSIGEICSRHSSLEENEEEINSNELNTNELNTNNGE